MELDIDTLKIIEKTINFGYFFTNLHLSDSIIDFFENKIDWRDEFFYMQFTFNDNGIKNLDKIKNIINWKFLCYHQYKIFTEPIIDKFHNYLDWSQLQYWVTLSESTIKKYSNHVDWEQIPTLRQKLTLQFVDDHHDKINWSNYLNNSYLYEMGVDISLETLEKYKKFIDWDKIKIGQLHPQIRGYFKDQLKLKI